ncbi:MAG: hypothetical protein HY076_06360 [Candidatus Eisenbacteria bacterium]|uniref:Uncharacterized protein n=1 Tax=Eiseniibacteriota bacterium TaxID=2212470 RepID=A0A9D6L6M2_UNCEI|nr:hypothetical protein [Candidatus Eisenbacteria bacterium]
MRSGAMEKLVGVYLAIGGLWCFISNAGAAITGRTTAFVMVTGGAPIAEKILTVLRIIVTQILFWPMDLYQNVGRIVFG